MAAAYVKRTTVQQANTPPDILAEARSYYDKRLCLFTSNLAYVCALIFFGWSVLFIADERTLNLGLERLASGIVALLIASSSRSTRRPFISLCVVGFICYQVVLNFMTSHIASALMVFPVALVVTLTLFRPTEKKYLAIALGSVVFAGVCGYSTQSIVFDSPNYGSLGFDTAGNMHFAFFSCLSVGLYTLCYYIQTIDRYYALVQRLFDQHQKRQLTRTKDRQLRALANVSHELRNPINGVIGSVEILANPYLPDYERLRYINILKNCSSQLRLVVNDVLDFTKLDSGQRIELILSPKNINQVFADVLQILLPQIKDKNIQLEYQPLDPPQWALIDNIRLQQILLNLLSNASKFTGTGGRISIQVSLERTDLAKNGSYAWLNFSVGDTGIGVSTERLTEIFTPFMQLDDRQDNKERGTGLGLPITKSLVELMGGKLDLTSREQHGTEVKVSIPVELVAAPNIKPENEVVKTSVSPQKLTVLIADDDYANRQILDAMLQRRGVQVISAENGRIAFELAMTEHPDLIILDMQMPAMDGVEAAQNILEQLNYQPTIIGLSGNTLAQNQQKCLAAGMKELLTKPIDLSRLEYWINYVSDCKDNHATTGQSVE